MANISGFLKGAMPWISAGLKATGPAGTLAANILGGVLKIDKHNPSTDELESAFANVKPEDMPALITALKAADNTYKEHMTAMGYQNATDLAKIDSDDRANARAREIAMKDKFWTPLFVIALIFIGGYFLTLYWVCIHGVAPQNSELAHELVIALTLAVGAIINYFFGASHQGDKNAQALATAATS